MKYNFVVYFQNSTDILKFYFEDMINITVLTEIYIYIFFFSSKAVL